MASATLISRIAVAGIRRLDLQGIPTGTARVFGEDTTSDPPADARYREAGELPARIPGKTARQLTELFRSIRHMAAQAAEPGQTVAAREHLQGRISGQLSELEAVFRNLDREAREAIAGAAGERNPSPDHLPPDPFGVFSGLDVRTESGFLAALDLSGRMLDLLAPSTVNLAAEDLSVIHSLNPPFALSDYRSRKFHAPVE